jgi:putative acetyltransferase
MLARTLARARDAGATRFAAWVTPFSRPLFLAAGFVLTQTVQAPFAGAMFQRHRVERDDLRHPGQSPGDDGQPTMVGD